GKDDSHLAGPLERALSGEELAPFRIDHDGAESRVALVLAEHPRGWHRVERTKPPGSWQRHRHKWSCTIQQPHRRERRLYFLRRLSEARRQRLGLALGHSRGCRRPGHHESEENREERAREGMVAVHRGSSVREGVRVLVVALSLFDCRRTALLRLRRLACSAG